MTVRLLVPRGSLDETSIELSGPDHHYLFRVRRLRIGDTLELFDGEGAIATAHVASISANSATLQPALVRREATERIRYTAQIPMIKGDRMDRCIGQLVELGVHSLMPYRAERAVVQLDEERSALRLERHKKLVRSAAQQSQRSSVPEVFRLTSLVDALDKGRESDLAVFLWEGAKGESLVGQLPEKPPASITLLSGPEGGMTNVEVDAALAAGYIATGLGPRILRAETAPVAALAAISLHYN